MCKCNPSIRTPWCGGPGCEGPEKPLKFYTKKQLTISERLNYLNACSVDSIKKIDKLERWCENHEKEGQLYGKEFEDRDEMLMHDIAELGERINLVAETLVALTESIQFLRKK